MRLPWRWMVGLTAISACNGVASAELIIRDMSGYPELSHTDYRPILGSFSNGSGSFVTAMWVTADDDVKLTEIAGVGGAALLHYPLFGSWRLDVWSDLRAFSDDYLHGNVSSLYLDTPSHYEFGHYRIANLDWPSYYVEFDLRGLPNVDLVAGNHYLIAVSHIEGQGQWGWSETDISGRFGPDPFVFSGDPHTIRYWTDPPTNYAFGRGAFDVYAVPLGGPCGDLDEDGDVDQSDLGILLADFGCADGVGNCPGDIDGDGDTDQSDLGVLLAGFGEPCR